MILDISLLLSTSLVLALGFKWLGQPSLIGYIISGIIFGPILNQIPIYSNAIKILGDFGLLMLIFQVGIEFDLMSFKKIWKKAFAIFIIQSVLSLFCIILFGYFLDYSLNYCVFLSFLLILSSTAVVVKLLEEMHELDNENGSLILSILILQDLAIIPMMITLNEMNNANFSVIFYKVALSIAILCALIFYLSHSLHRRLFKPFRTIFSGNQEIMTIASITMCFCFSALSEYLGLSHSYGPFIAGLILGSLSNKHDIIAFSKPIESLLMMIFFVFIGSNINIDYVFENIHMICIFSMMLIIVSLIFNYVVLRILRYSPQRSFFISTMLSQSSEFSFSLLNIVLLRKVITIAQYNMINTLCIISLSLGSVLPLFAGYIQKLWSPACKR